MRPKKSLGQNFLTSTKIVGDIVVAANISSDDIVLEVGPGKGILTEALLREVRHGRIVAVEKDEELVELLSDKFSDRKNLTIVEGDILKFNPEDYGLKNGKYKIVANIPYYITSHFLRKFLESAVQPSMMVLMVQKEVAERIVGVPAKRGKENLLSSRTVIKGNPSRKQFSFPLKESILSISVKAYGAPKIVKRVPAKHFLPKPKVDSAVLRIDRISKDFFNSPGRINEEEFFKIVKAGFSSKRKMLKNNLPKAVSSRFLECKIAENARAEDIELDDWKCLANYPQ